MSGGKTPQSSFVDNICTLFQLTTALLDHENGISAAIPHLGTRYPLLMNDTQCQTTTRNVSSSSVEPPPDLSRVYRPQLSSEVLLVLPKTGRRPILCNSAQVGTLPQDSPTLVLKRGVKIPPL